MTIGVLTRSIYYFIFCVVLLSTWSTVFAGEIKQISSSINENQTTVLLRLDTIPRYSIHQIKTLQNKPARCYIDLYSSNTSIEVKGRIDLDSDQVSRIRTGRHGTMTRVVLDLAPQTDCRISIDKSNSIVYMVTNSFTDFSELSEPSPYADNPLKRKLPPHLWSENKEMEEHPSIAPSPTSPPEVDFTSQDLLSLFDEPSENKTTIWGWAQAYAALDTNKEPGEDQKLTRTKARLGLKREFFLSDGHSIDGELSGDIDYIKYDNPEANEDVDIRVYESFLKYNSANWDLTVGKQRVRWGKSDQISPLDSINPDDLRQSMAVPLEERKLSSWLAKFKIYGENITVETIISPLFEKSELEYLDSDWALYRNLRQRILSSSDLPPAIKSYVRDINVNEDTPDKNLDNSSGAFRITWQGEQSDFSLSYHYGWETTPYIENFPVKNIAYSGDPNISLTNLLGSAILTDEDIEATYKRQSIIGFDWESVFEYIGFRGELAYIDNVSFLTSNLTSKRKPATHIVSGIDYTSDNEYYYNIQLSWFHIYGYKDEMLYYEQDNISLLGEIKKPIWRGNLELSAKFNYSVTDQSSYLQPSVKVKYFKNTEIETGAKIYSGDPDTQMGSYDEADEIYAQIKFSF